MKKEITAIIVFVILYIIFTDLHDPFIYLVKYIKPNWFYETDAYIVSEHTEELFNMDNSVNYVHYIDIEYNINNEQHSASIYWNKNDVIGNTISIYIFKNNYILRKKFGYSNQYLLSMIGLLIGITAIIKTFQNFTGRFYKYQSMYNKDNKNKLLKYYKMSAKDMSYDLKIIKKYLKSIKAIKLYNDLSLIYNSINLDELINMHFLLKKEDGDIVFISLTKKKWEDDRFKGYILLQKIPKGYVVYKISDDFLYTYNEQIQKYEYLCRDLCSYLILLKENSYIHNNLIINDESNVI